MGPDYWAARARIWTGIDLKSYGTLRWKIGLLGVTCGCIEQKASEKNL